MPRISETSSRPRVSTANPLSPGPTLYVMTTVKQAAVPSPAVPRLRLPSLAPGELAWATLGLGVVAYNSLTSDGQMLSEQADRWVERHPILTRTIVGVVAAHVANAAPSKYDPIHWLFEGVRRLTRGPRPAA